MNVRNKKKISNFVQPKNTCGGRISTAGEGKLRSLSETIETRLLVLSWGNSAGKH